MDEATNRDRAGGGRGMDLPDEPPSGEHPKDRRTDDDEVADDVGWLAQPASELVDFRRRGEYQTRYKKKQWTQIVIEFSYLVFLVLFCGAMLVYIGYVVGATSPEDTRSFGPLSYPRDRSMLLITTVLLSGIIGGASFSLKWLYHSVAKWIWNTDRILWRAIVPLLSGILALFVSAMISSGIVSVFNAEFFMNFYGALGGGFFIGYFSDNVLASLQNLAVKWFGTVDKRYQRKGPVSDEHDDVGGQGARADRERT